jgi:hypothetical protein
MFKARYLTSTIVHSAAHRLQVFFASIVSLVFGGLILLFLPLSTVENGGNFHFGCAAVIGGSIALVLSLSIIPAQKAAEAFSTAILKLYAKDKALLAIFGILSTSTMLSLYLGIHATGTVEASAPIAVQFLLLGASFDALRFFYRRALDLLDPSTAVALVEAECLTQVRQVALATNRLVKIHKLSAPGTTNLASLRAALFGRSHIAKTLNVWVGQLEEFALKAIAKRDATATGVIVRSIGNIGKQYALARRDSVVLIPDLEAGALTKKTDISDVLSRLYESLRLICEDAASHKTEIITRNCIETFGDIAVHALGITHDDGVVRATAPLAYAPVFYIKLCVAAINDAKMQDAQLKTLSVLSGFVLKTKRDVDTSLEIDTVLETFNSIALSAYKNPSFVSAHPAVEAMLQAALHDIQERGYDDLPVFDRALGYIESLLPLEVAMDIAGFRMLQTFPPYNMGSEMNLANQLQQEANRISSGDPSKPWISPFADFCEMSSRIDQHFRSIGKIPFGKASVRKWAAATLFECASIHLGILLNPPPNSKNHLDKLRDSLIWLLSASGFLFPEGQSFPEHHARETAASLAYIGMLCLRNNLADIADACVKLIAALGTTTFNSTQQVFAAAGVFENVEAMALAADVLGDVARASMYRKNIKRPPDLANDLAIEYLNAIVRRMEQFRERVEEYTFSGMRREPEAILHDMLQGQDLPDNLDTVLQEMGVQWSV